MKNIFDSNDNNELIARIEKLNPETLQLWGKMNVIQMMKHCIAVIDVTFGLKEIKMNFFMRMLGRLMKKSILNAPKFKKNSPTAPEFIFKDDYGFETTKAELINKTKEFQKGIEVIKIKVHPFWGKLSQEDWNNLQYKHLDHHLKQFGV